MMTSLLRNPLGMETGNESVSSFFDDSSHSESNAKEDVCDGDDELTDFEGNDVIVMSHNCTLTFYIRKAIIDCRIKTVRKWKKFSISRRRFDKT